MNDDKTIKKLIFPDYSCEIMESGDVFLSDHYAEHSIYIYKTQFERISKLYKDAFKKEKIKPSYKKIAEVEHYYKDIKKKYPMIQIWDELLEIIKRHKNKILNGE